MIIRRFVNFFCFTSIGFEASRRGFQGMAPEEADISLRRRKFGFGEGHQRRDKRGASERGDETERTGDGRYNKDESVERYEQMKSF